MNFNKHTFTTKEFLALPVLEEARFSETDVPFLLKGRMSKQQEYLQFLLDEHGEETIRKNIADASIKNPKVDQRMKITFWKKLKDGHIGEFGGTISFDAPGLTIKGDKLIMNFGDDDLTLEHKEV